MILVRALLALVLLLGLASAGHAQNFGNIPPQTVIGSPSMTAKQPAQPIVSPTVFASQFGAVGDGATDNTAAFARMFANTTSANIYFPAGVFRIACPGHVPPTWTTVSGISFWGAGRGATTIRYDTGCIFPTAISAPGTGAMNFINFHSEMHDLTIDMNTPGASSTTTAPIQFSATGGVTVAGPVIDNFEILNGTSPTNILGLFASSGGTLNDPVVKNSRFTLTAPDTKQNQCISLYTWWQGGSGALGVINRPIVLNNTCLNSAIQVDGANGVVSGNDISGWGFGNGIFAIYTQSGNGITANTCHTWTASNNVIHDAPLTFDSNRVPTSGIEWNCPWSVLSGNVMRNLGGQGIVDYADGTLITGNIATDVGKAGTRAVTISLANPAVITDPNPINLGDPVSFKTTGALPSAIVAGQKYYVVSNPTGSFQIAATVNGTPISTAGQTQSGTQSVTDLLTSTGFISYGCNATAFYDCGNNSTFSGNTANGSTALGFFAANSAPLSMYPNGITVNLRGNSFTGTLQGTYIFQGFCPAAAHCINLQSDPGYYSQLMNSDVPVAAFQWINLDAASFHSWMLKCFDLNPTTAQPIYIEFGEGPAPIWKTGSYAVVYHKTSTASSGSSAPYIAATLTGIPITAFAETIQSSAGVPAGFVADLGDLGWPNTLNAYKPVLISNSTYTKAADNSVNTLTGMGVWEGDFGSFTAVRVISPDTLTGQCTLTGKP